MCVVGTRAAGEEREQGKRAYAALEAATVMDVGLCGHGRGTCTQSKWGGCSVRFHSSVANSHSRMVWSREPDTSIGGSPQTASEKTADVCPLAPPRVRMHLSDAMFHTCRI